MRIRSGFVYYWIVLAFGVGSGRVGLLLGHMICRVVSGRSLSGLVNLSHYFNVLPFNLIFDL